MAALGAVLVVVGSPGQSPAFDDTTLRATCEDWAERFPEGICCAAQASRDWMGHDVRWYLGDLPTDGSLDRAIEGQRLAGYLICSIRLSGVAEVPSDTFEACHERTMEAANALLGVSLMLNSSLRESGGAGTSRHGAPFGAPPADQAMQHYATEDECCALDRER